jgi:hypothetical protein
MWKAIGKELMVIPILNAAESFYDHMFTEPAEPVPGSVVYCDQLFGYAAHSGVYIGDGCIVQMNIKGMVEVVSCDEFRSKTTALSIYVSCHAGVGVGCELVAQRARAKVYSKLPFIPFTRNCHTFVSQCLTGRVGKDNHLHRLKATARNTIGSTEWRIMQGV